MAAWNNRYMEHVLTGNFHAFRALVGSERSCGTVYAFTVGVVSDRRLFQKGDTISGLPGCATESLG